VRVPSRAAAAISARPIGSAACSSMKATARRTALASVPPGRSGVAPVVVFGKVSSTVAASSRIVCP
jgi:hypothetical protein